MADIVPPPSVAKTPPASHVLISTRLNAHPAVMRMPARAIWSWVCSITYLSRNGRADRFDRVMLREFDATPRVTRALIDVWFWEDAGSEIVVPQSVPSIAGGYPVPLWKFGPLVVSRPRIPDHLRLAVYERDGHQCVYCGDVESLTLDHIFPYSRGGKDTFGNLQTLCRSCNSSKGARV